MAFLRYGKVNYVLRPGATLLGRAAYCDVSFDDPEVSKEHALLVGDEAHWTLIDLKSTNGSYVSDSQVLHTPLQDGDRIRVGATDFHFFLEQSSEELSQEALFSEVWALGDSERASLLFPTTSSEMGRLMRMARPWVLDRLSLLTQLLETINGHGFAEGLLQLAAQRVNARRGCLSLGLGGDGERAELRFDLNALPPDLAALREARIGPDGVFEEGIVPEPSAKGEEAEAPPRPQGPYLYLPIEPEGMLYLEDPSEKRRFDDDDVLALRELVSLAQLLIVSIPEGGQGE